MLYKRTLSAQILNPLVFFSFFQANDSYIYEAQKAHITAQTFFEQLKP